MLSFEHHYPVVCLSFTTICHKTCSNLQVAIVAHQWLTTLCWVEEKIYGLISLVIY
jgi:hypothetical protein